MALVLEALLARHEERRGHGCDDYPARVAHGFAFSASKSLIREANRNPALLALCGFNPFDYQDKPKANNDGKPRTTSPDPHRTGATTSPGS